VTWLLLLVPAAAERNSTLVVVWGIAVGICALGVLAGIVVLVMRWGKQEGMTLEVAGIKAGNIGLGLFVMILGIAGGAASVGSLTTELGKDPPQRCDETGVPGDVDEMNGNRQPAEGTACVNADQVASFFDGQVRVTLRDFRARRIRTGILETAGDATPIQTECPFAGTTGLAAGEVLRLTYLPAPEDAPREDVLEWEVHVESVGKDSARVFVTRSASRYVGQALRDLQRRGTKGRFDVNCSSNAPGLAAPR
jgi:hypothetical protein